MDWAQSERPWWDLLSILSIGEDIQTIHFPYRHTFEYYYDLDFFCKCYDQVSGEPFVFIYHGESAKEPYGVYDQAKDKSNREKL